MGNALCPIQLTVNNQLLGPAASEFLVRVWLTLAKRVVAVYAFHNFPAIDDGKESQVESQETKWNTNIMATSKKVSIMLRCVSNSSVCFLKAVISIAYQVFALDTKAVVSV